LAVLCVTRNGATGVAGTTDAGIVRGLRRRIGDGTRVRIEAPSIDGLRTPCLVPLRWSRDVGHAVLVRSRDAGGFELMDPMARRLRMSREDFERGWMGSAIWIEAR
jgi:ABC-type bacteriocin/lantibiotic exporter with double-glycine peptidase domain